MVRVRLIEIGEAVKGLDPNVSDEAPDMPWKEIARLVYDAVGVRLSAADFAWSPVSRYRRFAFVGVSQVAAELR